MHLYINDNTEAAKDGMREGRIERERAERAEGEREGGESRG